MKKNRRILVVDDDAGVRLTICALLERNHLTCEVFERGPDALEAMRKGPVALVISDHRMPDMSGIELLQAIHRAWKNTRMLLVTGAETPTVILDAIGIGARVLLKPFAQYDFLMAVHGALAEYELAVSRPKKNGNGHAQG